jgi:hypothetical protein
LSLSGVTLVADRAFRPLGAPGSEHSAFSIWLEQDRYGFDHLSPIPDIGGPTNLPYCFQGKISAFARQLDVSTKAIPLLQNRLLCCL